jgi:hypothetical protein
MTAMVGVLALSIASWQYTSVKVGGFTLMVEDRAKANRELYELALEEIKRQIGAINRVVPDIPLAELKKIRIFIHGESETACMAFHPNPQWLREHKMDPGMAGHAEIGSVSNFVSWTYEQPWMVLHELAHGYHFRFLPQAENNPTVLEAYRACVESKKYEEVLHGNGSTRRHYGLNNQMEYFAEATEAYFGMNDFFPFNRAELRAYDPATFSLMESVWGQPVKRLKRTNP